MNFVEIIAVKVENLICKSVQSVHLVESNITSMKVSPYGKFLLGFSDQCKLRAWLIMVDDDAFVLFTFCAIPATSRRDDETNCN